MRERKIINSSIFRDILAERKKNATKRKEHVVAKLDMPEEENIIDDDAILNQFEPYDNVSENWKESREYWKSIFESEVNRDPELHRKFSKLHNDIVNEVIMFCKENNIDLADTVDIHIDGIADSIKEGYWTPGTDSSMSLKKFHWEDLGNDVEYGFRDKEDFLYEF